MGEKIEREKGVVFVSKNNGKSWTALHKFVADVSIIIIVHFHATVLRKL